MENRLPATTLSDAEPSSPQRRLALAIMAGLILYSAAVLPFASQPGPEAPSFIGIYQTAVIICDLLTAVLLLFQFRHFRHTGVLVLGAGYLFTGLIAIVHMLSFPGLLAPQGLIGGPQTTNWLWIIWHGSFPLFVLGYLLVDRTGWVVKQPQVRRVGWTAVGVVAALLGIASTLAITEWLPPLISGGNFNRINETGIGGGLVLLCLAVLALTVRERGRSVIRLWLMVAMLAFGLDVFHTLNSGARFAVGWYAARGNSFVASILVLAVFVIENGILLRHWVLSSTQLAETNAKLLRANAALEQALVERCRIEDALRQAKTKAEEVLTSIADGFYALDGEWRFTYINLRAQDILGKTPGEVMGRQFFDVFPQVRGTEVDEIYGRVMATRQPADFDYISPILKRWTSFRVYPTGDGGISVYFRDISDRKAAEQALIAAKEDAERANRAKSQFLAAASHDLRQPVQSLYFFHEALAGKLRGHPGAPILATMQTALDALKSLLDGLLDISKLHAGTVTIETSAFPIAVLLDRVVAEYAPRAMACGVALRLVRSSAWVHSDPAQLERIVRNLVDNALKYSPDGGAVVVGCRNAGDEVLVQVVDTGPGIPPERQDAVFEEFVQLDNPERDRAKGLGLGLAIVRHLARLLGHRVMLRSRGGHGTCFSVAMPRARAGRETVASAALERSRAGYDIPCVPGITRHANRVL